MTCFSPCQSTACKMERATFTPSESGWTGGGSQSPGYSIGIGELWHGFGGQCQTSTEDPSRRCDHGLHPSAHGLRMNKIAPDQARLHSLHEIVQTWVWAIDNPDGVSFVRQANLKVVRSIILREQDFLKDCGLTGDTYDRTMRWSIYVLSAREEQINDLENKRGIFRATSRHHCSMPADDRNATPPTDNPASRESLKAISTSGVLFCPAALHPAPHYAAAPPRHGFLRLARAPRTIAIPLRGGSVRTDGDAHRRAKLRRGG